MAAITKTEALQILPLATMKTELRIPFDPANPAVGAEHDELITGQILSALNFVSAATDRTEAGELDKPALRSAAILLCRVLYNGEREIRKNAAMYHLMGPFKSFVEE